MINSILTVYKINKCNSPVYFGAWYVKSQPHNLILHHHHQFYFFPSEQETPDGSQEKPRRRKKPKTPEPKVGGDSARENLGFQDDAAMEGDGVSTCNPLFCLFYRSVSLVSTPVYAFTASRGLSSLVLGRSLLLLPRAVNKGC